MRLLLLSLPVLAACGAGVSVDPTPDTGSATGGGSGAGDDAGEEDQPYVDEVIESVPGMLTAEDLFVDDQIHELKLTLSSAALSSLRADPRTTVEAQLTTVEGTYDVGVRLKGNTSMDDVDGKPAWKVDVNYLVPGQTVWGQPSFYLQNMIWDPSYLHEFLSYSFFQDAGVPAARAAYATLQVNDADYGLYLVLEKQNGAFMRDRFGDDSGSIYESGSFNWPCDLNSGPTEDPCTCFEVDKDGEGDDFADFQDLCRASRGLGTADEALAGELDMDTWRRAMAAEMLVSHYDNYGWNTNNFRIAHVPSTGLWYFTPWSADLSWGYYPWMDGPHCGTYGVTPDEYWGGMLMDRCRSEPECLAALGEQLLELADLYEQVDMSARFEAALALVENDALQEYRGNYGPAQFNTEIACMRDYVAARPEIIRDWVAHSR